MIGTRQITSCLVLLAVWLGAQTAHAQIDRPRSHVHYGVEIEPHLVVQWDSMLPWPGQGIGLGLRGSIPVVQDGPVPSINNSLAIGFGLDWAHFGNNCVLNGGPGPYDCTANDFWVPIVVQWNFFFSDLISAFPEIGLAIEHTRWDGTWFRQGNNNFVYRGGTGSDTSAQLVLWLGVRFHLSKSFALTLRLGTPSLLLGASFFL